MEKIKAARIKRPVLLSQIADHFDLPVSRCEDLLRRLVITELIFDHDLKRTNGGDYKLSIFATIRIFVEQYESFSPDTIRSLSSFMTKHRLDEDKTTCPGVYYLNSLTLQKRLEINAIKKQTEIIETATKTSDELGEFLDKAVPCADC